MGDDVFPDDGDGFVGVDDAVIVGEAEGDGAGVECAGEAEAAAGGDGDGGAEIELDGVVELVGVDAVDLGDVEVAVGGEPVGDPVQELESCEPELRWEDYLEEGLAEGQNSQKGGQRGPILLHFAMICGKERWVSLNL